MTPATRGRVGCTATLCGLRCTGTSATTVSVAVSMTDTRFDSWSAVYACRPSGENSTQWGSGATLISAVTAFVAVSTTEMVPESWLGT